MSSCPPIYDAPQARQSSPVPSDFLSSSIAKLQLTNPLVQFEDVKVAKTVLETPITSQGDAELDERERERQHEEREQELFKAAVKVKEWRNKLQRAFLSRSVPKAEEMPEYDQLFTTIENHEVTIEQLSFSKLNKVMRYISQLDQSKFPIQRENEYKIQKRAEMLVERWQGLIRPKEEYEIQFGR